MISKESCEFLVVMSRFGDSPTHVNGQVVQLDNVQLGLEPLHDRRRGIHRQSNRIPSSDDSTRTNLLELLNVLEVVTELDDRGTGELPLVALQVA